jgi:glyceraldehyde 3-phosphate dehydrogenase
VLRFAPTGGYRKNPPKEPVLALDSWSFLCQNKAHPQTWGRPLGRAAALHRMRAPSGHSLSRGGISMTVRVSINGFGRIGRLVLRAIVESKRTDIQVVGINDLGSPEANAHLVKYDSVHGVLPADVSVDGDKLIIGNMAPIKVTAERDPTQLPWKDLGVDVALECTGIFTKRDKAALHLEAGAKRVLVSAPADGADLTVVYGVNHQKLAAEHKVVSNGSCTTNCLAPVAQVLHQLCGIKHGFMTTVHAYTGDQNTVDTLHKDLRHARAAALSMIPNTTGAAKAIGLVLPELAGKLDGTAVRVPTPNVSLVDLKIVAERATDVNAIHAAMKEAANGRLKGVLGYNTLELVSVDFNHNPASSTFDATQTKVIEGTFVRVVSWYDNEWGFSNRMSDTAIAMAKLG